MKKIILLFTFLICITGVSAGETYDENYDAVVVYGDSDPAFEGHDTFDWDPDPASTEVYDGDWASYGIGDTYSTNYWSCMFLNYTKPASFISAVWKVGYFSSGTTSNIDVTSACASFDSSKLIFGVCSRNDNTGDPYYTAWYCMDGASSWDELGKYSNADDNDYARAYEEGVYWTTDDDGSPNVYITDPVASAWYSSTSVALKYSIIEEYLDTTSYNTSADATYHKLTGNTSITLSEGDHTVYVCANDSLDQIGCADVSFSIDTTLPVVNFSDPINDTYTTTDVDLNYSATDTVGINSTWYNFTSNATVVFLDSNITMNLTAGIYNIFVCANDSADNIGCENRSFVVDVTDYTAPDVNFSSPANETYTTSNVDLNYTATDLVGISSVWYNFSINATVVFLTSDITMVLANSDFQIFVCANDTSNNVACENRSFVVNVAGAEEYTTTGGGGSRIEPEFDSIIGECDKDLDMLGTAIKIWFVKMKPSLFLENTVEIFKRLWQWIMCVSPASIVDVSGLQ